MDNNNLTQQAFDRHAIAESLMQTVSHSAFAQSAAPTQAPIEVAPPAPQAANTSAPFAGIDSATLGGDDSMVTIKLYHPIKNGDHTITAVTVRTPGPGEMRRLSLMDAARADVDSLCKLLPRITMPMLSELHCRQLHPSDFMSLAGAISSFFSDPQTMRENQAQIRAEMAKL